MLMEKPQDLSFPPYRRRSPLDSETYRTLVRILSQCHQSECSLTTHISPQDLRADNGTNELVQACGNVEVVSYDRTGHENMLAQKETAVEEHNELSGFQDRVFCDTQRAIDEIEHIMGVEEDKSLPGLDGKTRNESTEGSGREQMILDEFQHLLEGKVEVQENSVDLSIMQVKENNGCRDIVSIMDNQEDQIDLQQIVMEEPLNAGQLEVDKEQHCQEVSVSLNSSLDKNILNEIPKLNDNIKDTNYSLKANGLEVEDEMQLQGGLELEKSALTNGRWSCPVPMIEDGDIEEGEVSGDFSLDDKSIDLFCEDAIVSREKNKDRVLISEGVIDKQDSHNNEKSDAKEKHSGISCFVASMADSGGKEEVNEVDDDKMISESVMVVHGTSIEAKKAHGDDSMLKIGRHKKEGGGARESFDSPAVCPKSLVYYGDILEENSSTRKIILEENSTENNALIYTEQQNANDQKKKIRGPRSTGSKERKKEKKRKKRAEKNRQLGVKRLKLQPVLKPKTVSYCRHYLKGRCQEGEKCKFSHDTIPLTKSKPCCHFARHSCMKGDDCPFDHQLSKYPCNNYTSNGTCGRGDGCMFSHQVPLKEGPPELNASKPELKPPSLVGDSSSKKQQSLIGSAYKNVNDTSYSVGINSYKKKEKIVAEILKPPELAPKGISYISLGKPSLVESSKIKQCSSSPKIDSGAKVGQQIEHRAPSVQISNETPKKTSPLLAPKGINFLSFGKPLCDLSGNKSATTMASDRECVIKSSLLDSHILPKQASSLPNQNNCVSVGKQEARSAIGSVQNEILKTIQPAEAALGTHTHSAEKSSLQHNNQGSLPSSGNDGTDKSSQENQTSSSKPESPRSTQWKIPAHFTSGESSKQSASGAYKNTTNSAQKALWSTFAFAAKYDSGMKMNRTVGTLAANTEANKETSIIGTGETKASKFLEFLSNIGNKTKQ